MPHSHPRLHRRRPRLTRGGGHVVSRVRRQQENGLTDGMGALPEGGLDGRNQGSAASSGAKDRRGHQAAPGRPPLKISWAPTVLSPENTLPALPLPFSGGNWGFCGDWSSARTGRCPPGERQTGLQPSRNRTVPAPPLPAITASPEASEAWSPGSGVPPAATVRIAQGPVAGAKVPDCPPPPSAPQPLW